MGIRAIDGRNLRSLLLILCAAIALVGCRARYDVNNLSGSGGARLDRAKAVYVAIPQDGAYGGRPYSGSGQAVAQAVAAAFSGQANRVRIAERRLESDADAIAAAKAAGAGYVAIPVIAHWEQRNTAWSGMPSRMAIRLTLFDTESGNLITSSAIEGRSRIMSMTATNPESLLREPLAQYVRGLC
jgi:hypothetical protein